MKGVLTAILAITLMVFSFSCRKKDDPITPVIVPPASRDLNVKFANMVGDKPLDTRNAVYVNENGDSFSVKKYEYYISNISLSTSQGQVFTEPESYHLVQESAPESKSFTIKNLPAGNYTSIKFLIGVDEARNTSGAQTGALDPINGMFWDWNTGYIMARIEGSSPKAAPSPILAFHMGGYTGTSSVLRWVTLSLPTPAAVADGKSPTINIKSDVLEWFKTPNTIDFSQLSVITNAGPDASKMADNYSDMFSVDHVDN